DGEGLEWGAVEEDLEVGGFVEAFDVFVAVAGEADGEFVVAVAGEGVVDQRAAAGAEGEAFDVLFLGEVGLEAESVAAGSALGGGRQRGPIRGGGGGGGGWMGGGSFGGGGASGGGGVLGGRVPGVGGGWWGRRIGRR